jgi:hypothetical protein
MLSKCANPGCSETFRYLCQGKIFCLSPTPEVETSSGELRSCCRSGSVFARAAPKG